MRRRRRGKAGGREGPFPTLLSPCQTSSGPRCPGGSGPLRRLRPCSSSSSSRACGAGGNWGAALGKTCGAASLPRAGRASSEGDLVLLAALNLGFVHAREVGGERDLSGAGVGRDPSVPLLTCLTSLSTFSTASGSSVSFGCCWNEGGPCQEAQEGCWEETGGHGG